MLKIILNKFNNYTKQKRRRKNICLHGYVFSLDHKPGVIGCYNGNVANSDCDYEKQYLCEHYIVDSAVLVKRIVIYTLVMGVFIFALIRCFFCG